MEQEQVAQVERIEEVGPLHPNDVIVVTVDDERMSRVNLEGIRERVSAVFPGYRIMICPKTVKISILRAWVSQVELVRRRLTHGARTW